MNKIPNGWTKEELQVCPGVLALARAVVKQWLLDGKPDCLIEPWIQILLEASEK